MDQLGGKRNPRTLMLIVVVVAIVVIVSGAAAYIVLTRPATQACTLTSMNPLIFDQPEKPDSLDPHVTFSTPGWGIVQQVYQSLVNYNGTDYQTYVPVLAASYSHSPDYFNWTFHLRQDVRFSNGDPFNAYVMWFSLNRALVMNQAGSFILQENFWYPGLNYYSDANASANASLWMANNLNTWNFVNPTPSQIAVMEAGNNSFQVIDQYTIQLNMGAGYLGMIPYTYLLASIAGPIASAVDPAVIQAHGGVTNNTNDFMSLNMLGTGPFVLTNYNQATGYLLSPTPGYWATSDAAAAPWNNIIQPARSSIQIDFQPLPNLAVSDLKTGQVAGASFAYLGPSTINDLKAAACVQVQATNLVFGSTAGGWWIYMNQGVAPFNDINVRAAVVHAINYQEIIDVAFGGFATRWVGPVPPGYPYYNPANLTPYPYDLSLARQEMNASAYPLPNGYGPTLNYEYIDLGDWAEVAQLLKSDLAKIGVKINPVGISLDDLYTIQTQDPTTAECIAQTTYKGGPFPIGQEFYTSDYIAPDDWTQNNAISYGSANMCMAGYANTTVDNLVIDAAGQSNPANLTADYTAITKAMYDNYTVAWLVIPTQFQVTSPLLKGFVSNPMGAALPFVVMQNTEYASAS